MSQTWRTCIRRGMNNIYELFHYAEGDVANKIRNGENAQNCPYVGFSQHISQ